MAQEARYVHTVRGEDRGNLDGGFAVRTTEEFCDFVAAQLRRIVTDPANRKVRRDRLEVAARALHSPDLAEGARMYQAKMLDAVTLVFADAEGRGLINADLDTRACLQRMVPQHDARPYLRRRGRGRCRGMAAGGHPRGAGAADARRRDPLGPAWTERTSG